MQSEKMCVALLFGGMSSEHEVSRVSVGNFVNNIDREKYEVLTVGITKEGRWLYTEATAAQMADGSWEELAGNMPCVISPDRADHGMILFTPEGHVEKLHIDVVIPVLHGLWGEDGTVQGLLELAGIPYVGCGVLASAVCMDKAVANALFDAAGIPHTKWLSACRWEIESDLDGVCDGAIAKLGWPIFVKPANAGSSVGITKAHDRDELKQAIALALENDHKVVFEAFVDGHEVECAVIGSDPAVATRPGEILAGAEFYTYDDKYKNGVSQVVIPARLSEEKLDEVKTYAAMAYTALNCEGLARCDFFVEHGTNPNADITREQLVTMMYRYAGSPKADGKLDSFSDAASVSTYAADAMQWAVANGIVNGSNGKLNPQDNATRAEVAAILMRFCEMSK